MRNKPKSFNLKSYAKVNLFLHILKKGKKFHNLESLAFFVNLYDEIKLIEDKKFSRTPYFLQDRSKNYYCEHVTKKMAKTCMNPHIGQKLVWLKII